MRLVTPGDSAPASVNKYLLPGESQVITVRRHPAILMVPVGLVLGGLILAGILSNTVTNAVSWIWWGWLALLAWFVWQVADWSVDYFVITNQRMILTTGIITRNVAMMPLAKVTDMSYQRSIAGRMLGYGEFVLESAGQDQAFRTVDYLPYPDQLYVEVCEMIFPAKPKPAPPPPDPVEDVKVQLGEVLGELREMQGRLETEPDPGVADRLRTELRELRDEMERLRGDLVGAREGAADEGPEGSDPGRGRRNDDWDVL